MTVTLIVHWNILFHIKGIGGDVRSSTRAVFLKRELKIALLIINIIYAHHHKN